MASKENNAFAPAEFDPFQLKIIADALTMKEANHNRAANATKDAELRGIHIQRSMETRQLLMAVQTMQARTTA